MDEIQYYKGRDGFVYWVAEYKWKGTSGQTYWGWEIVGAQLRSKIMRRPEGFVAVLMPPSRHQFTCNQHHIPNLPMYKFSKKAEAEGWLKLTCERWEAT